jgi:N-acetylneuraminic acid mutarotase
LEGYHSGLVAVGDQLYAVGGWQDPDFAQSFNDAYSLPTSTWRHIARSHCAHIGSGAVLGQDGRIYLGGGEGGGPGTCLESYDPRHDRWTKLAYIPHLVLDPGMTTGVDGRIYLIGGMTLTRTAHSVRTYDGPPLAIRDVQVYDPKSNRWSTAAPMPTARLAPAAVTGPDGKIYVIGGSLDPFGYANYVTKRILRTTEVYDPKTNHWSSGPSLRIPRVAPAAVMTPDGSIYAIGGFSVGFKATGTVEALAISPAGPK